MQKENIGEILEKAVKNLSKKKIVLIVFSVLFVSLLAVSFGIYLGYFFSPEKQLSIGAEIESVFLSEEGNNIYIKLIGGSNEKNITGVKFIFKDSEGKEYFYETQEGIEKIGKPYETSWINFFRKPNFNKTYDYNISLNDITDLESFENLGNISIIFIYEEEGKRIETPPLDNTTEPITSPNNRNNNGNGGSPPPASCPQKSCLELGFECGMQIDNCENNIDCGECEGGYICADGICKKLGWQKVNNGNPIDGYEPIYHLWLSSTVESILVEDGLIYLFDSETLGKVTGKLTNDKKWELLTEDGWSNSEEIIPKPVSIFDFTRKMKLFKFPAPDNRIFGIYNFGFGGIRTGILLQDSHGGTINFIFDGNDWLKWADQTEYVKNKFKGVIQSWGGIDSDFAFNGQDSGILIGDYGYSLGDRYSRLTALKYYKNSEESPTGKNWELWNGNGWGGYHTSYSTYVSIPEVIPWSELDNTPFDDPKIAFLGNNEYLVVFEYDSEIKALLYKDEEPYVWKWWDGANWQTEGDYNYSNIDNEIPKSYAYEINIINKDNNALIFIQTTSNNFYEIVYDSILQTFNLELTISDTNYYSVVKDSSNNIWLAFSNESGIFIMKKTSTEWSSPELIYSGTGTEVKNINFIGDVPIIFFAEDDRLYALSDYSSDFWDGEISTVREQKPKTNIAISSKIEFVEKWVDKIKEASYGVQTSGHPALDNEGILYSPHIRTCHIGIYDSSNVSQNHTWGRFWDYFYFPSGVDIDNIRGKVYISDYLTTGGSGGLPSGSIRIWNKSLNNQTFIDRDNNAGVIRLYSSFKFPSDVAVDEENGYLYVSDSMNNKIQKFDVINLDANNKPTKITDIENDFSFPQGIDLDSQGNLYVVDTGNHKIQKLDSQGNFLLEFGTRGFGAGEFILPYAISVDPITDTIYVSDPYKKEIQMFSDSGDFIYGFGKWQEETLQSFNQLSGIVAYNNILYVGADNYLIKFEIKDITPIPEYCTDLDKDGYYTGGVECGLDDCDDSNNNIHPYAEEKCDLIDWDCDGEYNDAISKIDDCPEVGERVGICENSERTCLEDGIWSACSIEPIVETYETCDMVDDNCDGEAWFFDENGCSEGELGLCTRFGNYECFIQKDWTLCPDGLDSECEDFDDCTEDVCLNGECVFTKFETIEDCYYCVNETLSSLEDPLVGGLDVNHDGFVNSLDKVLFNEYFLFVCDESNYYCNYRDIYRRRTIYFSDMVDYYNSITQNEGAECKIEAGSLRSLSLITIIINFFKNLFK